MFYYGVLISMVVFKIYLATGIYPKISFLTLGVSYRAGEVYQHISSFSDILTWVITIGAAEVAARLLHNMAGKTQPVHRG